MVLSPAVPSPEPSNSDLDFRGSRRLTGTEEWFWYVAAGVSYVIVSMWHKFLLNWFVGPLWLVAVVVVGPALVDRVRGRKAKPDAPERR
jgi:energy-converting hydrogenase Eha subunit G